MRAEWISMMKCVQVERLRHTGLRQVSERSSRMSITQSDAMSIRRTTRSASESASSHRSKVKYVMRLMINSFGLYAVRSGLACCDIVSAERKMANHPHIVTSVDKRILPVNLSSTNIQYVCYRRVVTTVHDDDNEMLIIMMMNMMMR